MAGGKFLAFFLVPSNVVSGLKFSLLFSQGYQPSLNYLLPKSPVFERVLKLELCHILFQMKSVL